MRRYGLLVHGMFMAFRADSRESVAVTATTRAGT